MKSRYQDCLGFPYMAREAKSYYLIYALVFFLDQEKNLDLEKKDILDECNY